MTEEDWLVWSDPFAMLSEHLRDASPRKLRLYAVACCRSIEHLLIDARSRTAVAVAEEYADGAATDDELDTANAHARTVWNAAEAEDSGYDDETTRAAEAAVYASSIGRPYRWAADTSHQTIFARMHPYALTEQADHQAALLRDSFGNPFRPTAIDRTWLTSTVVALAQGIYQDRRLDHLPILADALEDGGCQNENALTHCRSEGPHVRGCWSVDLILRKV